MPIYRCEKCGNVDNTALTNFWTRKGPALCSTCDTGKWHGAFPRTSADELLLGSDGFLYDPVAEAKGDNDFKKQYQAFSIIGKVKDLTPDQLKGCLPQ